MSVNTNPFVTLVNWISSHRSGQELITDGEAFDRACAAYNDGEHATAIRQIVLALDLDLDDDSYAAGEIRAALNNASAEEVSEIFSNDGQVFRVGDTRLEALVKLLGSRVYSHNTDSIYALPGGGHIALTGGAWDLVEFDEDGTPDDPHFDGEPGGWRSVEIGGGWNRNGWFFCDPA